MFHASYDILPNHQVFFESWLYLLSSWGFLTAKILLLRSSLHFCIIFPPTSSSAARKELSFFSKIMFKPICQQPYRPFHTKRHCFCKITIRFLPFLFATLGQLLINLCSHLSLFPFPKHKRSLVLIAFKGNKEICQFNRRDIRELSFITANIEAKH